MELFWYKISYLCFPIDSGDFEYIFTSLIVIFVR